MSDTLKVKSIYREYYVNFTEQITNILKELMDDKCFFIIDKNILRLYSSELQTIPSDRIINVEAVEANKTPEYCLTLLEVLIEKGIKRSSVLVAIGGGITQDITAFISTILFRGVEWIFIPTTLLAQADSCIGSKSSINFKNVKNLLGSFWPPSRIYISSHFLNSLLEEDIKSGIGEMLHYYYYKNSSLTHLLISEYAEILERRNLLIKFLMESLRIKKELIELDEFDKGPRIKFNYGHTFGHAIEALTQHKINHGQAVTIGMDLANYLSFCLNYINEESYLAWQKELAKNFPAFSWNDFSPEEYFHFLSKDKKNVNENLTCILTRGKGELFIHEYALDESGKKRIQDYFRKYFP